MIWASGSSPLRHEPVAGSSTTVDSDSVSIHPRPAPFTGGHLARARAGRGTLADASERWSALLESVLGRLGAKAQPVRIAVPQHPALGMALPACMPIPSHLSFLILNPRPSDDHGRLCDGLLGDRQGGDHGTAVPGLRP